MLSKKAIIEVNANFHHLSGESLFDGDKSQFKEYRKKWDEWPRNFMSGSFRYFSTLKLPTNVIFTVRFVNTPG